MERTLAPDMKTSLHLSGDWRHAWVKNGDMTPSGQAFFDRHGTRVLDAWPRPPAVVGPITLGLTIEVTEKDVQPWANDDVNEAKVEWVNAPPSDRLGVFSILLWRPSAEVFTIQSTAVLAAMPLDSGEVVVVLASHLPVDAEARSAMESFRDQARRAIFETEAFPSSGGGVPRGIFHRITPAGRRIIWDMALV
jgi:hypothetical protein